MNESTNIIDQLIKREKPAVPKGFFDVFFDTLMDEVDSKSGPLGQLTKSEPPILPANCFSRTFDFIDDLEESSSIAGITPSKKPAIPPHFFSDFPNKMDEIIGNDRVVEKISTRIIPLWIIGGISSIAAMLAIFFVVQSANTSTTEQPIVAVESEESYDAYLTYLDEDEIIDYIIETGIEIESINEEPNDQSYDDYSVQDIEEYYLETL